MNQLLLPNFASPEEYSCPLCGKVATLFGQYSPLFPWGVCRECSIQYPYPVELFVPSTRRNKDREPLMIDPAPELAELRERRIQFDEMLRCAVNPSRLERPIVKYNLSGLELRHPIRRSKAHKYQAAHVQAIHALSFRQVQLPICERCGCTHDRRYEMLPGVVDYWSTCQQCHDELAVETFWNMRAIFGDDDDETIMDRIQRSHPELFERNVLPDYWFKLKGRS